jgi:hypothetical protein
MTKVKNSFNKFWWSNLDDSNLLPTLKKHSQFKSYGI